MTSSVVPWKLKPSFIVIEIAPPSALRPKAGLLLMTSIDLTATGRNQIPVDGVAEGFVDAHAVLIDREPLRRAGDRRGVEAAEEDVGLQVVAG